MRKLSLLTIFGLFCFCSITLGQTYKDRQEVGRVASEIGSAFIQDRMKDLADCFADSSTFITVNGVKADNKHDIVEMHSFVKGIIDTTVSKPVEYSKFIKFIRNDIAIVYTTWGGLTMRGQVRSKPQSGYLTTVLEKMNGKWLVVSSTNAYNYQERPNFDFIPYNGEQMRKILTK